MQKSLRFVRWLLPLCAITTLAGYFGAWVAHPVSGLVITGLDLAEYVKFLTSVRSGEIVLWREGFFLPLLVVSLSLSLFAYRAELSYPLWVKVPVIGLAIIAALNMLPPAWTPSLLLTQEFRLQTGMMVVCLLAVALSPLLARVNRAIPAVLIPLFAIVALVIPPRMFLRVLPSIANLYNDTISPGWGMYTMIAGLLLLILTCAYVLFMDASSRPLNRLATSKRTDLSQ